MNRPSILCVALTIAGSQVGCASTQSAVQGKPPVNRDTEVDTLYVQYVDAVAKQRGTLVYWVNPPKKSIHRPLASRD